MNFSIRLDGETYKPDIIELVILHQEKQLYVINILKRRELTEQKSFKSVFKLLKLKIDSMEKEINKYLNKVKDSGEIIP